MAGKSLSLCLDFIAYTGERQVSGPQDILNEAVSHTHLLGDLLSGKKADQVVRTGKFLSNHVQFGYGTGFSFYLPNETFSEQLQDFNTEQKFYMRYAHDSWSITDQEMEMNGQGDQYEQKKDLIFSKRQATRIRTFENMESALWASASEATMEGDSGATNPYSIPAWITESGATAFSSRANIPSSQTLSRNQVSTYSAATIDTTLKPALREITRKVNFKTPRTMEQYISETKWQKFIIVTNGDGHDIYAKQTEQSNAQLVGGGKDMGVYSAGDLPWAGIPVRYIAGMDNIGYTTGEPRFMFINSDYLYPVFHSGAYFRELKPMNSKAQPYTWTTHTDVWYQLLCLSPMRQGIVVPA